MSYLTAQLVIRQTLLLGLKKGEGKTGLVGAAAKCTPPLTTVDDIWLMLDAGNWEKQNDLDLET